MFFNKENKVDVDFFLCYEHWQRELYGCLLLKNELEQRGYSVELSSLSVLPDNEYKRQFMHPKVVIYPWIYSDVDIKRALNFKHAPSQIVNLESEQFLAEYSIPLKFPTDALPKIAYHVCWGENTKKRFIEYGVPEDHIRICGSINLDINRAEYRDLLPEKKWLSEQYGLDMGKKWIIFFSDFAFLPNMSKTSLKMIKRDKTGKRKIISEHQIAARQAILGYFDRFLGEHDDYILIYRNRPNEASYMDDIFKGLLSRDNFRLISEGTIQQWIPSCDYLLSWISTSMIDGFLKEKKMALIRPIDLPHWMEDDLFKNGKFIKSYEDLESFLEDKNKFEPISKKQVIEMVDNYKADTPAFVKLADWLEEIYKKKSINLSYGDIKIKESIFKKLKHTVFLDKNSTVRNWIEWRINAPRYYYSLEKYNPRWDILTKFLGDRPILEHRENVMRERHWDKNIKKFINYN